ncbi:cob(I)yrinic acid a,c-diamide adenosyltransferase [Pseudokineococcus marinus]|uniref:Corrinoid adenosyltransferase n=1 Tax=Pseudokineococcus marinus TaxID=351215 RepID=A0A849BM70_9ACTN|nr:cob(I)yrinic acid a,c-diamide adenosyltransferase [Pseudokineococcus marinus]NNH22433.1 cob(I)yrinic acid a,c-diamide adenosyltransferase [Pseudokineococcus marinus]
MAVRLTRIWTGTGDDGTTGLGDFSRTSKTDPRLVAYADVDETGAALGLVLAALPATAPPAAAVTGETASDGPGEQEPGEQEPGERAPDGAEPQEQGPSDPSTPGRGADPGAVLERVRSVVRRVQNDLFDVGADLCLPVGARVEHTPLRVQEPWIGDLEREIDVLTEALPPLTSFVLAGGTPAAAHLHLARTVARRAERSVWAAIAAHGTTEGGVNPLTARYLNRLSDLLFVLARAANSPDLGGDGDVLWRPGGTHTDR